MKIIIVSDTHGLHDQLPDLEGGDLLIHCGDFEQTAEIDHWFGDQEFSSIVAVAGNHDHDAFERVSEDLPVFYNAELLTDQTLNIAGLKIYGTPWISGLEGAAFSKKEDEVEALWAAIPDDTDILITHVPPFGILDLARNGEHWGSRSLADRVEQLSLRFHCFGHVHASYGREDRCGISFVNASSISSGEICNAPIELDL